MVKNIALNKEKSLQRVFLALGGALEGVKEGLFTFIRMWRLGGVGLLFVGCSCAFCVFLLHFFYFSL